MKHKFTIELTDEQLKAVNHILPQNEPVEGILPMLIDLGLLEFTSFMDMHEDSSFLDKIKSKIKAGLASIRSEPISKRFGVMRPTANGGFEPVPDDELPDEIREHLIDMETKIDEGIRNGRSMVEVMEELGGVVYDPNKHHSFHPDALKPQPKTEVVSEGNLVHFPTSTKLH